MNPLSHFHEFVTLDGGQLVTDLCVPAATFGKRHGNVLRAYDNLDCSDEFNRLNFQPVEYADEKGELRRFVTMTKDGFTMLAMGFTGPSAMAFKEAYIGAFNAMADHIANYERKLWKVYQALVAALRQSRRSGSAPNTAIR
jgi:Rha family phage regulatory protein